MAIFAWRWAWLAALLLWPGIAVAEKPSFDCAKATTALDKLICDDEGLAARDAAMAAAFAAARSRAAGAEGRTALLADQRDWLAGRAAACPTAAVSALAGGYRDAAIDCMTRIYEQRIGVLDYAQNQTEWPQLPFRPSILEGAGQSLCEDIRRDLDASFRGPGLFVNPLGEREIGFAPASDAEIDFGLLRAQFDPYNRGQPTVVLQGVFDNGGLRLGTVRYWSLASAKALTALFQQPYWAVDLDDIGKPVIDSQAFPPDQSGKPRPFFMDDQILSVDETPHFFRYAGRVYVLARLRPEPTTLPDTAIYELSGPDQVKRRCLFRAHFPMADFVYDETPRDLGERALSVGGEAGPLLPAGKLCVAVGDGPRTLWDHQAYRPWVLERRGWYGSGIDPPLLARYLRSRALTGLEQYRAYQRYGAKRDFAIAEDARFFAERFARPIEQARHLASLALDWDTIEGSMIDPKDATTVTLLADDFEAQHALQTAAFAGDAATIATLLGADPKAAAKLAQTALDEPLLSDTLEHADLVRTLLDQGFDPNETGVSGRTPLMIAARLDLIEAARVLLERGAEVAAGVDAKVENFYPASEDATCQMYGESPVTDTQGRTALSYAAELASPAMVQLLLEHGADPDQGDENDKKPVDYIPAEDGDRAAAIRQLLK
jgi:uncharacterized protein